MRIHIIFSTLLVLATTCANTSSSETNETPGNSGKKPSVEWTTNQAVRHTHAHYDSKPHPTTLDPARFHTDRTSGVSLPLPGETDAFTFAVFGDRTGGPPEGIEILKDAIRDVNLFEPDMVMTVGDLIQGYNNTDAWMPQMREYKSVMGKLLCPWFPVAGNHDVYWRGENRPPKHHEANYEMHFGPLWYAFEHKNCYFIALFSDEGNPADNSKSFQDPEAQKMSPEQFSWLQQTLATAKNADHIFLFLHHPRWLEGGYGEDWRRVHQLLADAGNVRAVFAGHIHRMRYDGPKDGIEYVTLATVGGSQQGTAREAGFLHHYHLITVRKQQIAMACLPVGEVMNVREITGKMSDEISELASLAPKFRSRPKVGNDGQSKDPLVVELFNPTSRPVEYEVSIDANSQQWIAAPDHFHKKVYPGQRETTVIRLRSVTAGVDENYQQPELIVRRDYLTDSSRIRLEDQRMTIPVGVDWPQPKRPNTELAASIDNQNYFLVEDAAIHLPDGPFTLECWCKARSFGERVGLVAKTQSSEYGLFVGSGEPHFTVFLDRRYVEAEANRPMLKVGQWHHLAGVYDGKKVYLYVDGKLVASRKGSGRRRTNSLPLIVGGDVDYAGRSTSGFDGWIDDVRLSTTARYTGAEFSPPRRFETDDHTSILLHFDALVGPFTYDSSGNLAHANRVGQPELQPANKD